MMFVISVLVISAFLFGLLVCVRHDVPEAYAGFVRVVSGLLVSASVASVTIFLMMSFIGCGDVDKYSGFWYGMGCFLWEHSS